MQALGTQGTTEIEVIGEVAKIITSNLDIGQVYERLTEEIKKLVDFDRTSINRH